MSLRCTVSALAAIACAPVAFAGPDWDKDLDFDAGSTIGSSQVISIQGQVQTIIGRLMGTAVAGGVEGDFQDVYQLVISDPGTFKIDLSMASGGSVNFDACLWLFDATGKPLLGTNDSSPTDNGPILTNASNAGPSVTITSPGVYFLAISGFASQPTFFGVTCFPQVVFQPGVIAGGVTIGWDGGWSEPGDFGDYVMKVEGVSGVPSPGALALLGLTQLVGLRGRRRR